MLSHCQDLQARKTPFFVYAKGGCLRVDVAPLPKTPEVLGMFETLYPRLVRSRNWSFDAFTWDELTAAADDLLIKELDTGGFVLADSTSSVDEKPDPRLLEARSALIHVFANNSFPIQDNKVTPELIKLFNLELEAATQQWELINDFLFSSDYVKPDDSVASVMARLPAGRFNLVPERKVHEAIETMIASVKKWDEQNLYYSFLLSLPDNGGIKSAASFNDAFRMLTEGGEISGNIKEDDIKKGLKRYFPFVTAPCVHLRKGLVQSYVDEITSEREEMKQRITRRYSKFSGAAVVTPVQFLVRLKSTLDYRIRDPVMELAKLSVYFAPFILDPPLAGRMAKSTIRRTYALS